MVGLAMQQGPSQYFRMTGQVPQSPLQLRTVYTAILYKKPPSSEMGAVKISFTKIPAFNYKKNLVLNLIFCSVLFWVSS